VQHHGCAFLGELDAHFGEGAERALDGFALDGGRISGLYKKINMHAARLAAVTTAKEAFDSIDRARCGGRGDFDVRSFLIPWFAS
jgi:hypothetical protein